MSDILVANRYFLCRKYKHAPTVSGAALFSLRHVRRINYEPDKKCLDIHYFSVKDTPTGGTRPDHVVVHNIEERTFEAIAAHMLAQPDPELEK